MSTSPITINLAVYASVRKGLDVTNVVRGLVSGGNDDIPVNITTFGGDPDPGEPKFFFVVYSVPTLNNGNPIALASSDQTSVDLVPASPVAGQYSTPPQPSLAPSAGAQITINRAVYGTPVNGFDVTAICQAIVNQGGDGNGNYKIPLNFLTFGGDPDVGVPKSFAMAYSNTSGGQFYAGFTPDSGSILTVRATPAVALEAAD